MMEIYPKTVGMFGGELMKVSGNCYTPNSKIYCRFGTVAGSRPIIVEGEMINSMKGFCPVPILTRKGPTDIYFSKDGKNFTADTIMNVALPSRVGDPVYIQPADKEPWYSRDASIFSVPWDSKLFSDDMSIMIQVKLIGYRENSSNRKVEFKDLHSFGNRSNRDGHMTINVAQHKCLEKCEDFELGLLEASVAPNNYKLATQRVAIRYGPIPLGWWVNSALTNSRGSDWSDQKCREWNDQDSKNEAWTKNLLPCPCTLDQALADFGRWQADPGCNLFAGSVCYYHKGAKHCVRSVAPTVPEGSGNQCCYNNDGTLRYSQLDYQGSTPDRSHVWGASPYDMSDLVPSLSHWKHDVVTFYYCCLWNDYRLCDLYMEQRPTANCKNYDVPGLAFLRGDPHITTFDGLDYNFGGGGDFWLVNNYPNSRELMLQGRFEPRTNSWDFGVESGTGTWKPKALTAIALKARRATIEISVAPPDPRIPHGIDIEINRMKTFFMDKGTMWQDFEDFSILNNAPSTSNNPHSNFTILLTRSSVGINVVEINRLLHITVAASPTLKSTGTSISSSSTRGLLGSFDDDKDNDFTTRNKTVLSPSTDKAEIFRKFALSWAVYDNDTSNFVYNKAAEVVDPAHEYYEYSDIQDKNLRHGPTVMEVHQVCGGNNNCIYDYLITGDKNVARATKEADDDFSRVKSLAKREDNCGLPDVGNMVTLSSNDFRVDKEVKVTGCPEGMTLGTEVTFKCVKETVAEASSNDRADYGVRRKYPGDDTEYIIHWTPKPYKACTGGTEDADIGMIVGIVVAVLAAVIIVIIIAYLVVKKRKSGESSIKERKASKRETTTDPVAAEAMLAGVEARSPVYRGSNKEKDETLVKGSAV